MNDDTYTRRDWLKTTAGIAGAGLAAGCVGSGSTDTPESDDGAAGSPTPEETPTATATDADAAAPSGTDGSAPGFGVVAVFVAAAVLSLAAGIRRRE